MGNCRDSLGAGKPQSFFFSFPQAWFPKSTLQWIPTGITENSPLSTWLPIFSLQAAVVICECVDSSKTHYILTPHTSFPTCQEPCWNAAHSALPRERRALLLLTQGQTGFSHLAADVHQPFLECAVRARCPLQPPLHSCLVCMQSSF